MDVSQRQIRLMKCVPAGSMMYPDDRTAEQIAVRWNAQRDLVSMFGTATDGAIFDRLRRLEARGFVEREEGSRPTIWSLTESGIEVFNASCFDPRERI